MRIPPALRVLDVAIERLETALKGETDRLGWREAGETFVLNA